MENIFQETLAAVREGVRFRINFSERSLQVGRKYIIKNGEFEGELGYESLSREDFLDEVERLYYIYKNSIPSERSQGKHRLYFSALPEYKLHDDSMLFGEQREIAQVELELTVLCQIILGFQWDEGSMGTWFWQGQDKDLIMLRQWFEPNTNK
jgi:hypothetical protein